MNFSVKAGAGRQVEVPPKMSPRQYNTQPQSKMLVWLQDYATGSVALFWALAVYQLVSCKGFYI